jgi:hypothetical protein
VLIGCLPIGEVSLPLSRLGRVLERIGKSVVAMDVKVVFDGCLTDVWSFAVQQAVSSCGRRLKQREREEVEALIASMR